LWEINLFRNVNCFNVLPLLPHPKKEKRMRSPKRKVAALSQLCNPPGYLVDKGKGGEVIMADEYPITNAQYPLKKEREKSPSGG
jgi:hypothetical protein